MKYNAVLLFLALNFLSFSVVIIEKARNGNYHTSMTICFDSPQKNLPF